MTYVQLPRISVLIVSLAIFISGSWAAFAITGETTTTFCKIFAKDQSLVVDKDKCDPNKDPEPQVSKKGDYTYVKSVPDGKGGINQEAQVKFTKTTDTTAINGSGAGSCKDQPVCKKDGVICIPNPLRACTIAALIDDIATWLIWLAIPITALVIVWAGVLYITAGGSSQRIESAHHALTWAVIGFAIVLVAKGVTMIIRNFFGIDIIDELSLYPLLKFVYTVVT
ncbi:MAG: hypothetical protein UY09_C0018G0004 [Parcubacteria group bacterium GW2011_GWA2_47_8]|nr:MAG: hypothetical protein UY09_C0018G0004 [Parcubacteria group bacterium GW2011_GWA2_47_8]OHB20517.1 MAG: hypothetical protein A2666_03565 [Parcubacteria group bacterium RIFCSPHIGHO2_01_FULL_47_10b]